MFWTWTLLSAALFDSLLLCEAQFWTHVTTLTRHESDDFGLDVTQSKQTSNSALTLTPMLCDLIWTF